MKFGQFTRPPIQKNCIFEKPLYQKRHFGDPLYTTKCIFETPSIQQIGIFETPYKKWNFQDPVIQQKGVFDTLLYSIVFRFDPLYKKAKI